MVERILLACAREGEEAAAPLVTWRFFFNYKKKGCFCAMHSSYPLSPLPPKSGGRGFQYTIYILKSEIFQYIYYIY